MIPTQKIDFQRIYDSHLVYKQSMEKIRKLMNIANEKEKILLAYDISDLDDNENALAEFEQAVLAINSTKEEEYVIYAEGELLEGFREIMEARGFADFHLLNPNI